MPNKGDLYLGSLGSEVLITALGREFSVSDIEFSRVERAANATLRKDVINVKKKFGLDYSLIDGTALDTLIDIYNLQIELSLLVYTADTVYDSYTVLMSPIDRTRVLLCGDGLWSGVSVVLEEV